MKDAFKDFFNVDKSVLTSELRALQLKAFDVDKLVTDFNSVLTKYPLNGADDELLKELFIGKLPIKCAEALQV